MKIIILGPAYPYRGGIAAFTERLAQQYVKEDHNVEVYTFTLQYPNFLFPGKTQFSTEEDRSGLTIFRKINSCNPLNWIKVGKEIRKKNPDWVIINFWMPFMAPCLGTIARQIRKNKNIKINAVLHNVIPHENHIGDKALVRYFVNSINNFVAMAKSVLEDLQAFDKVKPKTFCPHPLYDHYGTLLEKTEAKRQLKLDENTRYVLFFGFIRKYKGLDLLIDAFQEERLRELNVKLLVAGEFYGNPAPYLQQIAAANLTERVVLHTDFIPNSEVNRYFSACDIVAQPYHTATQSGVTQIAFHFNKPMLVTNVGGLAEIVPHGKIGYVVETSPAAIAEALVDYFANQRETTFSQNIVTEKTKYTWENMSQSILKLHSTL